MSPSTVTALSFLLGLVASFCFQTGQFLIGSLALIASGILAVVAGPTTGRRVVGGLMIAFGLYVLALVLGFLIRCAFASLGAG